MALTHIDYYSPCLQSNNRTNIILPDDSHYSNSEHTKILYLLHGYNGDHNSWLDNSGVVQYVKDLNLVVVMPNVENSYYCNLAGGKRYWDYISDELPNIIEQYIHVTLSKENFYVAGMSMGGYGALKMAFAYPEKIAASMSFSGAVDISQIYNMDDFHKNRFDELFGSKQRFLESNNNLINVINNNKILPKIFLTCGTNDFLYKSNVEFADYLKGVGIPIDFSEKEGAGHTWSYWDEVLKYSIYRFFVGA